MQCSPKTPVWGFFILHQKILETKDLTPTVFTAPPTQYLCYCLHFPYIGGASTLPLDFSCCENSWQCLFAGKGCQWHLLPPEYFSQQVNIFISITVLYSFHHKHISFSFNNIIVRHYFVGFDKKFIGICMQEACTNPAKWFLTLFCISD